MGFFVKTGKCTECGRFEGHSPSGDTSLGIDETGRCGQCRTFVQRPCVLCGGTVTSRMNVRYLGPVARHEHCDR